MIDEAIDKLKRFKYHAIGRIELEDVIDEVVSWYEQMMKDYSWLIQPNPNIEPPADLIHTTDTAPVDGKELLYVADKSYKIGWRDCKEQMMENAVEGEIQMRYSGCLCAKTIRTINEDKFKLGDKVKLIVIKEDEK